MKKLTDKQLDLVLQKLLKDSAFDSPTLDEIADSPKLLWNIKREIKQENVETKKGWIWDFRWLIPTFASIAILLAFGLFWLFNVSTNKTIQTAYVDLPKIEQAKLDEPKIQSEVNPIQPQNPVLIEKTKTSNVVKPTKFEKISVKNTEVKKDSVKSVQVKTESKVMATPKLSKTKEVKNNSVKVLNKVTKTEEYKTDFIALSYLPTPESGQIVRVKVPRAMMVSLGVTNNVSKNDELVNAEVIVADDGTSRAIRFISDGK